MPSLIFADISLEVQPFTPAMYGAWKEGKVVTDIGAAWMGHVFVDNVKEGEGGFGQWRVADQLPAYEAGGTPTGNQGGSNVAATAQTKYPAAAVAYCLFTCASVDGQSLDGRQGHFPGLYACPAGPADSGRYLPGLRRPEVQPAFINLTPKAPTNYWRDKAFPQADVIVNAGLANIATKKWTPEEGLTNIANNDPRGDLRP